ncbi:hypothetical protein [Maricaulis salignorans]|uniref:hypothetical protein n=1 Tax=Maricaulis salignorans TaxID=144026 RepID=UPI003A8D2A32
MAISKEELPGRLKEAQDWDLTALGRRSELGSSFHLEDAVAPAVRTQSLLKEVPLDLLSSISNTMRGQVERAVEAFEQEVKQLDDFDPAAVENAPGVRQERINAILNGYEKKFDLLYPVISYASSRRTDLSALDREARRNMDALKEHMDTFSKETEKIQTEAEQTLELVKQAAEEQGVSQQALYFKTIADDQDNRTTDWLKFTVAAGAFVFLFAIAGVAAPHWAWLNWFSYQSSEPIAVYLAGKAVLFAVLLFGLYTCARNYFAHKHNAVVNRQRQTALQTFRVLADAARSDADRDVILTHAAACIFQPQDTGFVRASGDGGGAGQSVVEILRGSGTHS